MSLRRGRLGLCYRWRFSSLGVGPSPPFCTSQDPVVELLEPTRRDSTGCAVERAVAGRRLEADHVPQRRVHVEVAFHLAEAEAQVFHQEESDSTRAPPVDLTTPIPTIRRSARPARPSPPRWRVHAPHGSNSFSGDDGLLSLRSTLVNLAFTRLIAGGSSPRSRCVRCCGHVHPDDQQHELDGSRCRF